MADEIVAGGPQPEPPAKPSVEIAALQAYFLSIKEPFRETREGIEKDIQGINGAYIIVFIFCLIPLIPFLVSRFVGRYFGSTLISIRNVDIHVGSFWFWWVVLFIFALAALLIAGRVAGVSAEEKKKWLSPPQLRFAYCYAVVEEIGKYKTNQLPRHIDEALHCLDQTAASLRPRRSSHSVDIVSDVYWRSEMQSYQVQSPPKWYRLRPETELILKAFEEFNLKLRDRLKDRKDLPIIENALTFLAAYEYLEIPELSDSKSEARFEEGIQSLLNFATQITALPPYRSEELKPSSKETLSRRFFVVLSKLTAPFSHENRVVAFLYWLVFLFLLFAAGFYGALRLWVIKVDSTIITTLIGGPILGALTAVTIPRVGRKNAGTGN